MPATGMVKIPFLTAMVWMVRGWPAEVIVEVSVVAMNLNGPAYHTIPTGDGKLGDSPRL